MVGAVVAAEVLAARYGVRFDQTVGVQGQKLEKFRVVTRGT